LILKLTYLIFFESIFCFVHLAGNECAKFLEHYSRQMVLFGPFVATWTARFEAKHRDFVNFSEASKNFINVVKTLAVKNQKKLASR